MERGGDKEIRTGRGERLHVKPRNYFKGNKAIAVIFTVCSRAY